MPVEPSTLLATFVQIPAYCNTKHRLAFVIRTANLPHVLMTWFCTTRFVQVVAWTKTLKLTAWRHGMTTTNTKSPRIYICCD